MSLGTSKTWIHSASEDTWKFWEAQPMSLKLSFAYNPIPFKIKFLHSVGLWMVITNHCGWTSLQVHTFSPGLTAHDDWQHNQERHCPLPAHPVYRNQRPGPPSSTLPLNYTNNASPGFCQLSGQVLWGNDIIFTANLRIWRDMWCGIPKKQR